MVQRQDIKKQRQENGIKDKNLDNKTKLKSHEKI